MKLHTYLLRNNIKQSEFATKLGVSRQYFNGIMNRKRVPSNKLARKIEELTKGNVTLISIISGKAIGKDLNQRFKSKNFVSYRSKQNKENPQNKEIEQFSLL